MNELRAIINLLETESVVDIDALDDQGGAGAVARGVVLPNLNRLKELAHDNFVYLINAFERQDANPEKQILICEALQHRPRVELDPFFLNLLDHPDPEFVACASIALGKTKCTACLATIFDVLSKEQPGRLKYHLGLALLLLEEPAGIDVLIGILESEREDVEFTQGQIKATGNMEMFCVRIALILGSLFSDFSPNADPFRWIGWRRTHLPKRVDIDSDRIPANLTEYYTLRL